MIPVWFVFFFQKVTALKINSENLPRIQENNVENLPRIVTNSSQNQNNNGGSPNGMLVPTRRTHPPGERRQLTSSRSLPQLTNVRYDLLNGGDAAGGDIVVNYSIFPCH